MVWIKSAKKWCQEWGFTKTVIEMPLQMRIHRYERKLLVMVKVQNSKHSKFPHCVCAAEVTSRHFYSPITKQESSWTAGGSFTSVSPTEPKTCSSFFSRSVAAQAVPPSKWDCVHTQQVKYLLLFFTASLNLISPHCLRSQPHFNLKVNYNSTQTVIFLLYLSCSHRFFF